MEELSRASNIRTFAFMEKRSLLPSRSPSQCFAHPVAKYTPCSKQEYHDLLEPKGGHLYHHRVSSDTIFLEEQPAWVEDLLSEPESPIRSNGHRRAASDSVAYLNQALIPFGEDNKPKSHYVGASWLFQSIDHQDDIWRFNSYNKQKDKGWELPTRNGTHLQNPGSLSTVYKVGSLAFKPPVKQVREGKDASSAKPNGPASKNNSKWVKQQNAQRARIRRLQYISELERNAQMLQAEVSKASSAIYFMDQQLIMLSMENRALKQHLDTVGQIQKLKEIEQEMLEREIGSLRFLHHQQQRQQQQKQQKQKQPKQLMQQNQYMYHPPTGQELESQFAAFAI